MAGSMTGMTEDEMRALGSLILREGDRHRVPAGSALAVDRDLFSAGVTAALEAHPLVTVERGGQATLHNPGQLVIFPIHDVRARGARVIAIAEAGDTAVTPFADEVIRVPRAAPMFEPLLSVVPLHVFAMELSEAKGLDVDQPRNLAKSVTVE